MSEENVVYVDEDLEDLIPGFIENRHKDTEKIKGFLNSEDWQEIQRLGHSMKGSGGGYGFHEVTRIGQGIEEAAKTQSKDEIMKLTDSLSSYLSTVKIVIESED